MNPTCTASGCSVRGHHCTLPADLEGELRDLARDLRSNGAPFEADKLERLVNRHSGIKPLREAARR